MLSLHACPARLDSEVLSTARCVLIPLSLTVSKHRAQVPPRLLAASKCHAQVHLIGVYVRDKTMSYLSRADER